MLAGAVAQLAPSVSPHGPDRAIRLDEKADSFFITASRKDGCHPGIHHLHGVVAAHRGAVAQLAVGIVSVGPEGTVLLD